MKVPAYQGIKDFILGRIAAGAWAEGDRIPSENVLAGQFAVARMTVNRALRELSAEQVLERIQGRGTYVARPKYESTLVAIRSISDDIEARGHRHQARVLDMGEVMADSELAAEMQLPAAGPVFRSRVLHTEDGEPVQWEERWVNPQVVPDYLRQDFVRITPNQYLTRVAPLQKVAYRIEARLPPEAVARQLSMHGGEPCLVLHRRTWSGGEVASVVDLWHPGSRYRLTGHF